MTSPSVSGMPGSLLLERESELERLGARLSEARAGSGSIVVVEGPAGQGKTALLRSLRDQAAAAGFRCLVATGAAIERDFSFGLVRQLLESLLHSAEPGRRDAWLAGAAALAAPIFELSAEPSGSADVSHARLHGLYWLTANIAAEQPLLLVVDDAHWGDAPSVRFVEALSRRVDDLPIVLAVGVRPAEPGAEQELLDALVLGPHALVLRPQALSREGVAAMLLDALGRPADEAFVAACVETTRGNPLLVRELCRSAAEQGLRGSADEAGTVRRAVPGTISRVVLARLRRLAPDALATARGIAILGDRRTLARVAALAGISRDAALSAQATLARVGLLEGDDLRFAHPMVLEAVRADLVGDELGEWYRSAARVLAEDGAADEEVAAYLLASRPDGDPAVARRLADAAAKALADGAPDVALRLLGRAFAEPPAPADLPRMLLARGTAEARAGDPRALEHLSAAAAGDDLVVAAQAERTRATLLLMLDRAREAAAGLERTMARLAGPHAELAAELEDDLLDALQHYDAALLAERRRRLGTVAADPRPAFLAHLAFERAATGAPAAQVLSIARRSVSELVLDARTVEQPAVYYAVEALLVAEADRDVAAVLDRLDDAARRSGSRVAAVFIALMRTRWEHEFGDLRRAEDEARRALEMYSAVLPDAPHAALIALATALLDRGQLDEADRAVSSLPPEGGLTSNAPHAIRGRVRLVQGRVPDAIAELETLVEIERARGWVVTPREHSRATLIAALAQGGRREEALVRADTELALALHRQAPGAEAATRMARARALDGSSAIDALQQAVAASRRSSSRLLQARALGELGSALRRAGRRAESRVPLREARDLAHRCGAVGLEEQFHEELVVAGARPQRVALSGVDALTAAERRVAELAARGLRNREIAETLFVTLKTVEVHLGHAYTKLGIKGRSQLAGALGFADAR